MWSSQAQSLPDAFYGSVNSTGQGSYTSHLRLNSNGYPVEDLTSGWSSNVQANGSFTPGDGDQYWLGANGQVVLAVGSGNFYSIVAGLHAVNYAPPIQDGRLPEPARHRECGQLCAGHESGGAAGDGHPVRVEPVVRVGPGIHIPAAHHACEHAGFW